MILRFAVSLLLVVVAAGQIYLARTAGLSPWKGGGFGMFSTVDMPSARFLRVHLLRGSEEIPVLIPRGLQPLAVEIRTLPRPGWLTSLAQRLAAGSWVPFRFTPGMQRYLDASGTPDLSQLPDRDQTDFSRDDRPLLVGGSGGPLLRMVPRDEALPPGTESVPFDRVRVEVWRYTFDVASSRLTASRLLAATADRAGRAP